MDYLPEFSHSILIGGGAIPRVGFRFIPAKKLPCIYKTVSVNVIKHAFIINVIDYSSACPKMSTHN